LSGFVDRATICRWPGDNLLPSSIYKR